jgi:hypothetical protein
MRRLGPIWLLLALLVALGLSVPVPSAARADGPTLVVDWPTDGAGVGASVAVTGWAVAPASDGGTGVDAVRIYLDGPVGTGTFLGLANYGLTRPDVALALHEARYGASGWRLDANLPAGARDLFVYAHLADQSTDDGWTGPVQVAVRVEGGSALAGLRRAERAVAPVTRAAGSGGCATRDASGPGCAGGSAPTSQCAVPDRESGRCLVRAPVANSRGPAAVVPGSWTAPDPAGATSADYGAGSVGSTAGRIGYPVAAGGSGGDRSAADVGGSSGSALAGSGSAVPLTASAASAGRPASASLSLSVAQMGGQQIQLNWNAFTAGSPVTYEVRRCASLNAAAATCGVVATVQGGGYRLTQADGVYFVRALGPTGEPAGESNRVHLCCRG